MPYNNSVTAHIIATCSHLVCELLHDEQLCELLKICFTPKPQMEAVVIKMVMAHFQMTIG